MFHVSCRFLKQTMRKSNSDKKTKICNTGIDPRMYIGKITIENPKVNGEHFFKIGYCPELKEYLLSVFIAWIAGYDRYYKIDEGDVDLYGLDQDEFCAKYENEIRTKMTERLIGSAALRDYDFSCLPDEVLKTLDSYPPFEGYSYKDGILYARIKMGDTFFIIPPIKDKNL